MTVGCAVAVLYGVAAFAGFRQQGALQSFGFLGLVPLAVGAVPLLLVDPAQVNNYRRLILVPWISILALLALLPLLFGEGALCLIMLGAPFIGVALLVTLTQWILNALRIRAGKRAKAAGAGLLMLLPFVCWQVERGALPTESETTASSIDVAAAPADVWPLLAEVAPIAAAEFKPGILHVLGVPRPLRASVDRAALGGKRTGYFESELRFDEVITRYSAPRDLAFSVAVDLARLRPGSAERHAFGAGCLRFDSAAYHLEALPGGSTRLQLESRYVVRTGVNRYAKFWARLIASDFQDRLLALLKARAEADRLDSAAGHVEALVER
ncbi:MAG TPA: SRPBCC family protein [Polyangiaceae bacterium]|nr:SRPBCC family protein [Polyangiaceae bacterium]